MGDNDLTRLLPVTQTSLSLQALWNLSLESTDHRGQTVSQSASFTSSSLKCIICRHKQISTKSHAFKVSTLISDIWSLMTVQDWMARTEVIRIYGRPSQDSVVSSWPTLTRNCVRLRQPETRAEGIFWRSLFHNNTNQTLTVQASDDTSHSPVSSKSVECQF